MTILLPICHRTLVSIRRRGSTFSPHPGPDLSCPGARPPRRCLRLRLLLLGALLRGSRLLRLAHVVTCVRVGLRRCGGALRGWCGLRRLVRGVSSMVVHGDLLYGVIRMWSAPVRRLRMIRSLGIAQAIMKLHKHCGVASTILSSSLPADRFVRAEHDRDEQNPETPPEQVHSEKMITILEVEHEVSLYILFVRWRPRRRRWWVHGDELACKVRAI
jgi:hypothetical protein